MPSAFHGQAQQLYYVELVEFAALNFLFAARKFLRNAQKVCTIHKTIFITNFVTGITNLLTRVTNFVICVTNFVTNFFCADNEKFLIGAGKLSYRTGKIVCAGRAALLI